MRIIYYLSGLILLASCSTNTEFVEIENKQFTNITAITMKSDTSKVIVSEDASLVAERYLSSYIPVNNSRSSIGVTTETITGTNGKPLIYIVNYGDNDGYALVSAQKYFEPVIAHSETGHFDLDLIKGSPADMWLEEIKNYIDNPDLIPDSIKEQNAIAWLHLTDKEIQSSPSRAIDDPYAESIMQSAIAAWREKGYSVYTLDDCDPNSYPYEIREAIEQAKLPTNPLRDYMLVRVFTESNGSSISGMIKTQWQQGAPYNNSLPLKGNLGCVPIAVAQVMYYHKYPTNRFNFDQMPLSMLPYDDSMVLPNFLKVVGEACGINYSKGETGSTADKAKKALEGYGYNATKISFNSSQVCNSLAQKKPVLFGGSGHMWICDGYSSYSRTVHYDLMCYTGDFADIDPTLAFGISKSDSQYSSSFSLHMIWGWNPSLNGSYSSSTGKWTVNQGNGATTYSCSDAIINIAPK